MRRLPEICVIDNLTESRDDSTAERSEDLRTARTRDRLLRAGAQLFAEQGFHAVSVRAIVAAASVNLGAINYHFGSKQALFEEIFAAGASHIVEMRMRLLDGCRDGPGRPPLLEQVVTAYLAPGLADDRDRPDMAQFQRIRARIITEDSDLAHRLLRRHFRPSTERFLAMLQHALPGVPRPLLLWRYQTMIATVVYGGSGWGTVHSAPDGNSGADDSQALDYLVPLIASMFRTPPENQPTDVAGILAALMEA